VFLDIINRPVSYLQYKVSEAVVCLRNVKNMMMDNVLKHNNCINIPSSQRFTYFSPFKSVSSSVPKRQALILKLGAEELLNFTSHGRGQCHSSGDYLPAPDAVARVESQVTSCEFSDVRSGNRVRFLRVLWFPLQILIEPSAALFSGTTIHLSLSMAYISHRGGPGSSLL
jgi:hypothetical protein